jgi:hypothetical protein
VHSDCKNSSIYGNGNCSNNSSLRPGADMWCNGQRG